VATGWQQKAREQPELLGRSERRESAVSRLDAEGPDAAATPDPELMTEDAKFALGF
jgi:hypothetical protein